MRVLGVDYGDKRIGLALSDPLCIIASPLETFFRTGSDADFEYFKNIVAQKEVHKIVLGLPKNMDGTEGSSANKVRDFALKLETHCQVPVQLKDERLSSVSANRLLDEAEVHWSKRAKVVDKIAAQIILQTYLDAGGK